MPRPRPSDSGGGPSTPARRRSSAAALGHGRTPKLGVLAAANRIRDATGTPGRVLSGSAGAQPAPLVVESQRYEEWMKIATDNKITSTNTWNLALIDYFHDMSLLRNGDDNSINFQKASCTLDGCVKIWTSRVDSVASETGKLLSGLGEGATQDNDDMDNDDEDGDDEEREQKRAKKRAARSAPTLADSFSKLRIKSFDLEFTVDPLFKKTSADFDEGGAAGLLMNHLAVDGGMRVVFDAGDARLEMDEEDMPLEEREEVERRRAEEMESEGEKEVPIAELYKCFSTALPPSTPLASRPAVPAATAVQQLSEMSLCPSLSSFRFSADSIQSLNLGILNLDLNDDDFPLPAARAPAAAGAGGINAHLADDEDFGGFDQQEYGGGFDQQEYGGGFDEAAGAGGGGGGEVDFFADEFTPAAAYEAGLLPTPPAHLLAANGGGGGGFGHGAVQPFDPSADAADRDLVLAMGGGGEEEGLLEYFDQKLGGAKGWAGPEHWKMARRRGAKAPEAPVDAEAAAEAKAAKKAAKVAFSLDFSAAPALSAKELFAPAAPKSSITAPVKKARSRKAKQGEEDEEHCLPADYGFNSSVLLRLFLKPKMTLRMRRRAAIAPPEGPGAGGEEDVQFWAQAGMGAAGPGGEGAMGFAAEEGYGGGEEYGGGFDNPAGGDDDDFPPPFDTQWLALGEADDDATFPSAFDASAAEAEKELDDLAAASAGQVRRARPETVNYAKRAKRVDVKRLKESIWRELEEVVLEVKEFPKDHQYDPTAPPPALRSPAARPRPRRKKEALIPVVSSLRRQYPKDKMAEISTSYMFICLLHLANEKGLRIQTPAPMGEEAQGEETVEEGEEMRKLVGGLEGLRVMREVSGEA